MEPEEGKLSVWVCREEKLVSGVSKRTTCADVVRVLLEDQGAQRQRRHQQRDRGTAGGSMLSGSPQSYCVAEKWRGFERILPNKTRILRLWGAWGDERDNVRFVLVKHDASLPNNGPRSAEARVVQSKDTGGGPCPGPGPGDGGAPPLKGVPSLSQQDKQRRVVRKAFRKLDKMNRKREEESSTAVSKDKASVEKMETLVHLVISQDHTIRQQVQRIRELDREIERYEARVHFDRIKRHGVNYVQDTYMEVEVEVSAEEEAHAFSECKRKAARQEDARRCGGGGTAEAALALARYEEYARRCEEVLRLEEELAQREALVESITGQLQEELNLRWMERRRRGETSTGSSVDVSLSGSGPGPASSPGPGPGTGDAAGADAESPCESDPALEEEEERIKTQLDTSLYIGLRLHTDLETVKGDLDLSLEMWEAKEQELLDLLANVETLEVERLSQGLAVSDQGGAGTMVVVVEAQVPSSSSSSTSSTTTAAAVAVAMEKGSGWVDQARGLSNTCNLNDDDSDTGLSSMHSQDSDNPPVCESLV
ncbi:Ras association domain-containing protein 10 [Merluccius polli]|uniref:Ras association domain-containing protein 10 n=1 Tax=Merluccius polli TaxID=89951 RepID=A0AA47M2T5_MERPO|nr:Ras association domain-containing protein 10 [Merluccius polli]